MHNSVLKMGQCSVRWLTAWGRELRNGTVLREGLNGVVAFTVIG